MKPLADAKTRLRAHLSPRRRADLCAAMLASTLAALSASSVAQTLVVGGDERVKSIAREHGAEWMADRFMDLNLAVADGFGMAWRDGRVAAYIPADLPLLTPTDVDDALEAAAETDGLILCPAQDGGTNGIFAPPARNGFSPRLGADSFRRHLRLAERLGIPAREFTSAGFERDVDTIDDLRWCIERGAPSLTEFRGAIE